MRQTEFIVTGSVHLVNAFISALDEIGYENRNKRLAKGTLHIYPNDAGRAYQFLAGNMGYPLYTLPNDWDKCIELAKQENIPEYVECIEDYNGYAYKGTIYKVHEESYSFNSLRLDTPGTKYTAGIYIVYDKQWFIPSTKEAFDKQNSKLEIGGYEVEITTNCLGGKFVKAGCQYYTPDTVGLINNIMVSNKYNTLSFDRGGETITITKEQINKILALFDKN